NDTWYYADSNGRLEKGSISIDGKSYTFAENGAMLSGANDQTTASSQEDYNKKAYVNTNSDFLNVRSEASTESSVVDKLARGTEVNIVGNIQNGFYPIVLNEKNAWVSSDWISFEKPTDIQSNTDKDKKPVEDHKE
ncbi:SH3 domain-containing protein, partial [Clostridium paraputrificum]